MTTETPFPSTPQQLQPEVVSFWGLVGQSIAGMAPTCDVVAFMTAGAAFALVAMPLSYLAAFLLMFIEVNTIHHLSKHPASAGGYYAFVAQGLGGPAALFTGFMVVFYQMLSVAAIPVYVGGVLLPGLVGRCCHEGVLDIRDPRRPWETFPTRKIEPISFWLCLDWRGGV